MTGKQIEELSKDIRKALDEQRLGLDARLEIAFAWGDLGYCAYMDGPAAQEIAQKHGFGQRYKGECYHWQI